MQSDLTCLHLNINDPFNDNYSMEKKRKSVSKALCDLKHSFDVVKEMINILYMVYEYQRTILSREHCSIRNEDICRKIFGRMEKNYTELEEVTLTLLSDY